MKSLASLVAVVLIAACGAEMDEDLVLDDGEEQAPQIEDDEPAMFEQAYEQMTSQKADSTGCSGILVPDGGFHKKIALTFDDGPNPATTPKIIAVLHKHHAPATFFNNGYRYAVPGAKAIAKQIAADPSFMLANHSQNHLDLASQSATKVASEVNKTDTLIRAAGEHPKYFRFPFGSASCSAKTFVQNKGYIVVGWTIDSADWCYASGGGVCPKSTFKYVPDSQRSNMIGYIVSQATATGGGIILMHDIHGNTASHLDQILTALEAKGFTFVRLDNKTVFPKLNAGH